MISNKESKVIRVKKHYHDGRDHYNPASENDYTALRFLAREVSKCIVEKKPIQVVKSKIHLLLKTTNNFS